MIIWKNLIFTRPGTCLALILVKITDITAQVFGMMEKQKNLNFLKLQLADSARDLLNQFKVKLKNTSGFVVKKRVLGNYNCVHTNGWKFLSEKAVKAHDPRRGWKNSRQTLLSGLCCVRT